MSGQGENKTQFNTDSFTIPRWLSVISAKCGMLYGSRDFDDKTVIGDQYGTTVNVFTSILKHTQDWHTERSLNIWIPQTL